MKLKFKYIEAHDIKNILRRNNINSFTKDSLIYLLNSMKNKEVIYHLHYIEDKLQELVSEGYLSTNYSSVKVDNKYYGETGSKSVATYVRK